MNISQEIENGEKVIIAFFAGEWAKIKHFFEGTSADETVQQSIPAEAAVTVIVTKEELAAAKAAHAEAAAPAPEMKQDVLPEDLPLA